MSKQSFTPGPWLIERDNGDLSVYVPNENATTYVIAERIGGEVFKGADGRYSDYSRVEANARLIAAAPELLEALQSVVDEHGARYLNGTDDRLMPAHRQLPAIRNAMEAIAKARGES